MSRGLGTKQRTILAALAGRQALYLRDLLPRQCTKAEYNALLRAATKLETGRLIAIARFMCGSNKVVVHRIGTAFSGIERKCLRDTNTASNQHLDNGGMEGGAL